MLNVTFDTNCIIALEEDEAAAVDLRLIVNSAVEQKLRLRVVAISASERPRRRETSIGFDGFKRRIAKAGLGKGVAEILPAPAIWNVAYWDHCVWMDEARSAKLRQIHGILFPHRSYKLSGNRGGTWLNRLVDTCALWTHLHHGSGAFVTADANFHKKTTSIQEELSTSVLSPHQAAAHAGELRLEVGREVPELGDRHPA